MKSEKSLEKIELQMAKLREKKDALHEELRVLAAERRKLLDVVEVKTTNPNVETSEGVK